MEQKRRPGYLTEYARHAGISKTAAAKQLTRVGIDYFQPFDFAEADKRREAARHADRAAYSTPIYVEHGESPWGDGDGSPAPIEEGKSPAFAQHQAKKEEFRAKLAELDYRERVGELVERDAVDAERFQTGRQIRDALQNIPSRVAGLLAAETDQRKCHDLLDREIRLALEGIAGASA